ncbi:thiamine-phosphate kinase [Nanoarchaeota archaeon]
MKIKDIGGEFALINRVTKKVKNRKVIVGIGDDCAVIEKDAKKYTVITTDMLVENDHFRLDWATPLQVGKKAMEANVSDVASMGGMPKYALVSLSLTPKTSVEIIDELYKGFYSVAKKYGFDIIGGDMTHGSEMTISITIIGEVEKNKLALRSNAKPGELILVTGVLGGSTAGLELLLKDKNNLKKRKKLLEYHLNPTCRLKKARHLVGLGVKCMIDVSDGLASEVKHICEMSKTGAVIFKDCIPLDKSTRKAAEIVSKDPYDFALSGGEDFELVFTLSKKNYEKNKSKLRDCFVVGKILDKKKGIYLFDGVKKELAGGYDHFKS